MEGSRLYAHRSGTGICIYIIEFTSDGRHVATVNCDRHGYWYGTGTEEEELEKLNWLLDWWQCPAYNYYSEWLHETAETMKKAFSVIGTSK